MLPALLLAVLPLALGHPPAPRAVCPRNATAPHAHPANFSLYVLSMQWPFSVCAAEAARTEICRAPPPTFTVRGLWPTSSDETESPTCCGVPFSLPAILDIAPALRRFWPDFSPAGDDPALWETQWLKHGSCTGLALRTYFRKVLELSRRYDFLRALNSQGIVASLEKDHDFDTVQRALNEATGGYAVRMRCTKAAGHIFLDAVHVCLHRSRFETVQCPQRCLHGQVGCCEPSKRIRIPYWRHEHEYPNNTADSPNPQAPVTERGSGFWVGQIAGVIVLAAGLAYWLFKQFLEQSIQANRQRPNRTAYQRIAT